MKIISAQLAYNYAKTHYPIFPKDWNISAHFCWNDVFISEIKSDGVPPLSVFINAVKTSQELEKARVLIARPFNVHCWYRSQNHNLRLKKQGLNPAMHSSHLYAMAVDYDISGLNESVARAKLSEFVKMGKLKIRIEANTKGWIHNDIGNPYTKDYHWGMFYI